MRIFVGSAQIGAPVAEVIDTKEKAREYFPHGQADHFFEEPVAPVIKLTQPGWTTGPSNPVEDIKAAIRLWERPRPQARYAVSTAEYNRVGHLMQQALGFPRDPLPEKLPRATVIYKCLSDPTSIRNLERWLDPTNRGDQFHVSPAAVNQVVVCGNALAGVTSGGKPLEVRCALANCHAGKHEARLTNGSGATVTWGGTNGEP